jgi:signal transduction histidine kinase
MRFSLQRLFNTCWCLLLACRALSQSNGEELVLKLKEASYYDSVRFFSAASDLEKVAGKDAPLLTTLYLYKGNFFFYLLKLEEAKKFFELTLTEARKHKQRSLEVLAQIRLAYVELDLGSPEKAEKEMIDLLAVTRQEHDALNTAEILNFLGLYRERENDLRGAVKYFLQGITLAEEEKLNYFSGVYRNNLGLIKYASGQLDEALQDYKDGLKYALLDNNMRLVSHIKMNMCIVFVSQRRFREASSLFTEVTEYSRKNNLPVELASVYMNLASSYSAAQQPMKTADYIDSAIVVLRKHNLYYQLGRAYLGKCDALIQAGNLKEAGKTISDYQSLGDRVTNLENMVNYYFMLYRIADIKKDKARALENYLQYTRLRDSLNGVTSAKAIKELQVKYDVERKEVALEKERTKSLLLEKTNQRERFLRWFIATAAAGSIALVVLFSIVWYTGKLRAQQEQFSQMLIKDIEAERARIARDLHDDIGQSLSIIKSKVNQDKGQGSVGEELSRVIEQTREISRNLYPAYLEKIGLVRALATLMEKVQASTGIECSFDIDERIESKSMEAKTHIYRIVQECVNNTIKHSGANALKVSVRASGNDFFLTYRDNGKGIASAKTGNGLGLQSIQERVKMFDGTITWGDKNEKGFVLNIKFPKNEEPVNS